MLRRSRSSLSIRVAILPESNRPLLVIPTVAKRSGGICSAPCGSLQSFLGSDPPKKSQPPTGGVMGRRPGLWPTQADENQHLFSNHSPGSTALPLVIPTGAQRSGGTCGSAALSWKCFSTEESWAFGQPKVMKNGSCFSEAPPSPLSSRPERSAVEGPAVSPR